jgi:hypothetical protein
MRNAKQTASCVKFCSGIPVQSIGSRPEIEMSKWALGVALFFFRETSCVDGSDTSSLMTAEIAVHRF